MSEQQIGAVAISADWSDERTKERRDEKPLREEVGRVVLKRNQSGERWLEIYDHFEE